MSYYPQFAEQLGRALDRQARSQNWLAQRLGIARGTVNRWLNQGTRPVTAEVVVQIADLLGLSKGEGQALLVAAGYGYQEAAAAGELNVHTPLFVGVPARPNHFLGRTALVEALVNQLIDGRHLALAAEGLPGVGKTTLAVALAHHPRILTHFRDGILWAGLGPTPDVMSLLGNWAQELDRDVSKIGDEQARAEIVKSAIGQRRLLLVLDDAWTLEAATFLRCGGPYCCHLLTTRNQWLAEAFAGPAQATKVPVLAHESACQLLAHLAPHLYEAYPTALQSLAQAVDGLPLALELLGSYLATPAYRYFPDRQEQALTALADATQRLQLAQQRLGAHSSQKLTLQEMIALSLEALPAPATQAFYALGAFAPKPATFQREAAESVAAVTTDTVAILIAQNLLEKQGKETLALHQTLADMARTGVEPAALDRHGHYYLSLVNRDRENWQQIAANYDQIKWAWTTIQDDQTRLAFVNALEIFQKRRGLWRDAHTWVTQTLTIAEQQGWITESSQLRKKVGAILVAQGQWEAAIQQYQVCIDHFQAQGNQQEVCIAYNSLGSVYYRQAKWQEALAAYQSAGGLAQTIGAQRYVALAWMGIGNIYHILGDWAQAEQYYQQSRPLLQNLDDRYGEAQVIGNLGNVYDREERWADALAMYHQCLALFQALGDRQGEAQTFNNLGNVHANQGQLAEAMALHQQSLLIFRELEDRHGESQTLNNIGVIYKEQGQWEAAIAMYEADLVLCRSLGDRYGEGETLSNLGELHAAQGQGATAIAYWQQALALMEPGSVDYQQIQERLQTYAESVSSSL